MSGLADRRVEELLAALASRGEPAAGGVAAALACATAAALVELTAGLAANRLADGRLERDERLVERMTALGARAAALRGRLPAVADEDVEAYARVMQADPGDRPAALESASGPPLEVAETAAEVAEAAAEVAVAGEWPFTPDAAVAANLAAAAAASAAGLVAADLDDPADPRAARARDAAARAPRAAG